MMPRLFILFLILLSWSASSELITHRAKLSSKRDGVGGIRVADHYYLAGGFVLHDLIPTNITDIYNVATGAFEDPLFLEEPRAHISTAVIGQNIYFIGGVKDADSCAMMYNTTIHQYEDIGCGPTVRLAVQVSTHNSTVTVLGSFSADFYDAQHGWYSQPKLTYWMQGMSLGALLVHENLIVGIGGVNTTTREPIYDAWIYDANTDNLTVFKNITTDEITSTSSAFTVAHDRVVIYFADRFFVHQFGTIEWHEDFMPNITNAVILPDVLFIFNTSGYNIYNWTSMEPEWSSIAVKNVYSFDNQVVVDLTDSLLIYEDGMFMSLHLPYSIQMAVQWGDMYVFHTDSLRLRLYDSQTKTISYLYPALSLVSSIVPFNESTLVIFQITSNARLYNLVSDTLSNAIAVGMSQGFLMGSDIVSYEDKTAWISLGEIVALSFTVGNNFADGIFTFGPQRKDYFYIDVFNYMTRQWQPRIPMTNLTYSIGTAFAPVVVIDDMLVVGKRTSTYRYNTTSGESSVTQLNGGSWPTNRAVNTVPVMNHVGYLPGIASSAIVTVNVTAVTIRDDLLLGSTSAQYVTSDDNVIYTAVSTSPLYYNLNAYNIATGLFDTVLLPSPQASVSLALINDTLITLGNDGSIYGLLRSDRLTWYQTPLQNDFVRPITVAINANTIMVAAGKDITLKVYTDELIFINTSAVIDLGIKITTKQPIANAEPIGTVPDNSPSQSGLTPGELIAAIVVPVVVGVGGLIALAIILIKKRSKTVSSTLGLEARYGAWFTPFDQITFGEQLGQGGSGQVFKGKWKNTTVALKVSMTEANNSVITELELMMQLRPHPNVVQLLGFSVHPETNSIILIIEFCDGGSLDAKLYDNRDEIPIQTRLQLLTGVAKGLYHLHSNNIVHRDVAARNVLVHRNEPKLTDFGMSRLVDEQKQYGTTKSELGPIRWMSPESLKNKEYSTKSDIWSFGILLFEVITRQEPHNEADPIEIGRQIRDEGLTPVIPSSCPSQLSEIMKQCWQMSSQSRPKIESLVQLLEALQE